VLFLVAVGALLCGCGKSGDESLAKRTGNKLGEAMTDFASGVGGGVDKQLTVDVELSDALGKQGFSKTVAKSLGLDISGKGISVYLIAENAYQGELIAKARNEAGQEVGRSVVEVEFKADDARYVKFLFDDQVDMQLVKRFTIDARPGSPDKASAPNQ
jgi:hypothetical protein